jgi:hypothetical protein
MRTIISCLIITITVFLTSCSTVTAKKITLTQFESGEVIVGNVNSLTRDIAIAMPNGEVLQGKFTLQKSGDAYALLKSTSSNLMLEIRATVSGSSGFGEAQSNGGTKYRVQF